MPGTTEDTALLPRPSRLTHRRPDASFSPRPRPDGEPLVRKRFRGTASYITSRDLEVAVDASVTLKRPLLVKGEPGTGKTMLAFEIAAALGMPLIQWHIK